MIRIKKLCLGELATNCYLLIDEETNECLIIDPADDANFINDQILKERLEPKAILATHGHFDHVLAVGEIQAAFQIPFLIHKKDEKILKNVNKSASFWLKRKIITLPIKINDYLQGGSKISLGKNDLEIIHLPGHTPGSIVLFNRNEKIAFAGDLIFEHGLGRTDFSYSSKQDLEKSLQKLKDLLAGYTLYPGHGDQFYL